MLYNRFLATRINRPREMVSVVKRQVLETGAQVDELTRLGSNPLEILLGPDPGWPPKK